MTDQPRAEPRKGCHCLHGTPKSPRSAGAEGVPDRSGVPAGCSAGRAALAELARVVEPGGWLLVAFHVSDAERAPGQTAHIDEWWDHRVNLDFHFLDPDIVVGELTASGWTIHTRLVREPHPGVEHPSRRAYLLAQRSQPQE